MDTIICKTLLIVALFGAQLFGQSNENDIHSARFELSANDFLNSDQHNYLSLDAEQWMTQRLLLKEYCDWNSNYLENVKRPNYEELKNKFNQDLYERFVAVLDDEQKSLLDQFMTAKVFAIKMSQMTPQVSAEDVPAVGKSIVWLHPEISSHIGLAKDQHDAVNELLTKYGDSSASLRMDHEKRTKKFLDSWNLELSAELTLAEKSNYEKATGKRFKFDDWIESKFKFGYRLGPLPLANPNIHNSGVVNGLNFKEFSLVKLPSMFNNEFEWNSLFSVLKAPLIAKELNLSKSQIEEISELESNWEKISPVKDVIKVSNSYGLKPVPDYVKQKKLQKPFEVELNGILNAKQNERLRQLWNQIVIGFGWKEVPLAHPDWKRALKLSEKTIKAFEGINKAKRQEFAELKKGFDDELKENTGKFKEQLAQVLTEKQNKTLDKLFGRFRELVD